MASVTNEQPLETKRLLLKELAAHLREQRTRAHHPARRRDRAGAGTVVQVTIPVEA